MKNKEQNHLVVQGTVHLHGEENPIVSFDHIAFEKGGELHLHGVQEFNAKSIGSTEEVQGASPDAVINCVPAPYTNPAVSGPSGAPGPVGMPGREGGMGGNGMSGAAGSRGINMSPMTINLGVIEGNLIINAGGGDGQNGGTGGAGGDGGAGTPQGKGGDGGKGGDAGNGGDGNIITVYYQSVGGEISFNPVGGNSGQPGVGGKGGKGFQPGENGNNGEWGALGEKATLKLIKQDSDSATQMLTDDAKIDTNIPTKKTAMERTLRATGSIVVDKLLLLGGREPSSYTYDKIEIVEGGSIEFIGEVNLTANSISAADCVNISITSHQQQFSGPAPSGANGSSGGKDHPGADGMSGSSGQNGLAGGILVANFGTIDGDLHLGAVGSNGQDGGNGGNGGSGSVGAKGGNGGNGGAGGRGGRITIYYQTNNGNVETNASTAVGGHGGMGGAGGAGNPNGQNGLSGMNGPAGTPSIIELKEK